MVQFICGIVLCSLVVIPTTIILLRKKSNLANKTNQGHAHRIEELAKLTGSLAHEMKNPLSTIKINLRLAEEELEELKGNVGNEENEQLLNRAFRKISILEKETNRVEQILEGFLRYVGKHELAVAKLTYIARPSVIAKYIQCSASDALYLGTSFRYRFF